jgi:hypothetical protein
VITTADVATWLATKDLGDIVYVLDARGFTEAGTKPAVMITSYTGLGFQNERATDVQAFQVRVRGPQRDKTSQAAILARRIDVAMVTALDHGPITMGGAPVRKVDRAGGGPSQFGPPDAGGLNVQMNCNYLIEVGSGIG